MVAIRSPFDGDDLAAAWPQLRSSAAKSADDFAIREPEDVLKWSAAIIQNAGRSWAVLKSGGVVGWLAFDRSNPVSGVLHTLLDFVDGSGVIEEAMRLAMSEVLADGYESIVWPVLASNIEMQEASARMGAKLRGVLPSATVKDGAVIDVFIFGTTRAEFL